MIDYLVKFDTDLFLFLNGLHSPFWDGVMLFASGKLTWLSFYLLLIYFIARSINGIPCGGCLPLPLLSF